MNSFPRMDFQYRTFLCVCQNGLLQRKNIPTVRCDLAVEGIEVDSLDRVAPAVSPDLQPTAGHRDKSAPFLAVARNIIFTAPILKALASSLRREKEHGLGAGQAFAGRMQVAVRHADGGTLLQVVAEMFMHRGAHFAVAGEVDEHGWLRRRKLRELVVGQHAVVAAEAGDEGAIAG